MLQPKYVVFDRLHAVVVSPGAQHAEAKLEDKQPTSAGFFDIYVTESGDMDVKVYGESTSLNLAPGRMDSNLLKITLGLARAKNITT